ncbi:JAB domain-containing protein [Lysinibacillus sp. UGB7]|uniref:JAB domain-containing protein n=1 Tax=Lysinibacillus sp. UGB7 TaxID=3411039 RepID=UPI003B7FA113
MKKTLIKNKDNLLVTESLVNDRFSLVETLVGVIGEKYKECIIEFLSSVTKIEISQVTESELKEFGFTTSIAKKVLMCIHFSLALMHVPSKGVITILSPNDVAQEMMYLTYEPQEHFVILGLNTRGEIILRKTIFKGTLNSTEVHPREVMRELIKVSAAKFITVHNHPSGSTSISQADSDITARLQEVGYIVGIEMDDHIIIGDNKHLSMKARGYFI